MNDHGERNNLLGSNGSLDMHVVPLTKLDTLELEAPNAPLGIMAAATSQQYQSQTTGSSNNSITLDGVMSNGSRSLSSNNSTAVTFTSGNVVSSQEGYSSLEYVTQMPGISDEQPVGKFPDSLVDNVSFVEINETAIKGNTVTPSAPLDFYLDVIPTTTVANTVNTSQSITVHHTRHEHQTPKAQLLERYSVFELQQQQQQLPQQQQQQEHSTEHMLQDVSANGTIQLEPEGISHELRKPIKLELQKRQMHQQLHQQQTKTSQHVHSSHQATPQQHHQFQQIHQQSQQVQQRQSQQSQQVQQRQSQQQHPHRLQQPHKQYQTQQIQQDIHRSGLQHNQHQLRQIQPQQLQLKQEPHQLQQHQQEQEQHSLLIHDSSQTADLVDQNQHSLQPFSRSGRPIKRRPEYVEYVSQNLKDEELSSYQFQQQQQQQHHSLKVEGMNIGQEFEEQQPTENIIEEEDHEDEYDSNDEDNVDNDNYTADGKKSLPHKKRIPKKLKNTKKPVNRFKCGQCEQQFISHQQLSLHKQTHLQPVNKPKPFNCELCNKGFESQLKFFEHLKGHYEPFNKHKCEVCGGEFDSAEALMEHALVHSREHHQCDSCNKTFRKESMLEMHIKVAHMEDEGGSSIEKPYTCQVCPKSFTTQINLDTHIQSDHSENLPEFNCEHCYRAFKSKAKLLTHQKIEHKDEGSVNKGAPKKKVKVGKTAKGYPCHMCTRVFTHKNSLTYHIRGHTGERPHQCDQCGKAFFAAGALKVHLRLHSGEKPFKCDAEGCGKFFRQWGDLRYHTTSVHSDERLYQCEYCGKDFKRKYCLVVHRRIHTGEKNYVCEYCKKAFRAASYLQNHKRIHTGERPHPCPDCGKPFRVRSDMKRHRQTHKRDQGSSLASTSVTAVGTGNGASAQPQQATAAQRHHVQLVSGSGSSQPQLIITDQVGGGSEQPIRIMVSGLQAAQQVGTSVHPPPAHHRQSQGGGGIPVSAGSIATLTTGPVSPGGTTTTLTPEVIIMDDNTQHPINLNIPRMIIQGNVAGGSPQASHATIVAAGDEYQLNNSARSNTIEVREEESGNVYVWHGVFSS